MSLRLWMAMMQSVALAVEILGLLTGMIGFCFIYEKSKGRMDRLDIFAMISALAFAVIFGFMAYQTFSYVLTL